MPKEQTRLLVTSGDGPRECQRAVTLCLRAMAKEAKSRQLSMEIEPAASESEGCVQSALVSLTGQDCADFARHWCGTIQWICNSPFRPHHKRQNWYIAIFPVENDIADSFEIESGDLRYETFRAGGPGGQHQNTTDSAVRLTYGPSGLSVISRDERSQHRNKQVALERLRTKFILMESEVAAATKRNENQLHKQLERGNPTRIFRGDKFSEQRK
nr:peptide chain release factor H [uncultured Cohaesibacter sp.]